jgi:hypothetical protein
MKIGLNNDELQQLVRDLKAGKTWPEVVAERLSQVYPEALAASDYKEWAHREAGIPLPEAVKAAPVEDHPGKRGKK